MTALKWGKLTPILSFAVISFVYLTLQVLHPSSNPFVRNLYYVGLVYTILWWFQADRNERNIELPFDYGCLMVAAWPIAVPLYLIKTRGWKSLGMLIVLLGFYALVIVLVIVFSLLIKLVVPFI